ncbi:MAG: hypothetical protein KJ607_13470, partial [Bacteroidetes bacterium]|nr:hypothetical protein [Bacteroidota bacterium]
AFYGSDHNPSICWLGSGYSFENINTTTINGCEIYTATLEKEGSRLYTAWWFDNGEHKTIEQFSWRWNSLKGQAPYRLINVTCETGDKLLEEVTKLINTSMI